jgi:hypothetical protein
MKQGTLAGLVLIVITIMIGAILLTGVADEAARQTRDFDSIEDEVLPTVDETGEDLSVKGTLPRLRCNMVECRDEFFFDPINPIFYWEDDCTVYAEEYVDKHVDECWMEVGDSESPFDDFAVDDFVYCDQRYECSHGYSCTDESMGALCEAVANSEDQAHDNDWDTYFQIMIFENDEEVRYEGSYVLPEGASRSVRAIVKWANDTGTYTTTKWVPYSCVKELQPNGCQGGYEIELFAKAYDIAEESSKDWGIGCVGLIDFGQGSEEYDDYFILYQDTTDTAKLYEIRLELFDVDYELENLYYGTDFECDYNYDYDNERPSNWIVNLIPLFFVLAILAAVLIWLRQQEIFDITDSWRK